MPKAARIAHVGLQAKIMGLENLRAKIKKVSKPVEAEKLQAENPRARVRECENQCA